MADSNKSGAETNKGGKKSPQGAVPDSTTEANIKPNRSAANIDPNKK
jgi:hypothetical protein